MTPRAGRPFRPLALLLLILALAAPATAAPPGGEAARARLKGLRAQIAWSSDRDGNHELYLLTLPGFTVRRLTRDPRVDFYPRFSPDGRRIVFARSQVEGTSERDWKSWDVYLLELEGGREALVARDGAYPEWVDGNTVSFLRGAKVMLKNLAGGGEREIYDSGEPPVRGTIGTPRLNPRNPRLLAATASGKLDGNLVLELDAGRATKLGDGCELGWFPDGERVHWVEPRGQGGTRIMVSSWRHPAPRVLMDHPGAWSHEYFARLSRDGNWLVWGISRGDHEHDQADYELFLWNLAWPWDQALRLTHHPGNDRWPDIFLEE